jgi:hypothetical protein
MFVAARHFANRGEWERAAVLIGFRRAQHEAAGVLLYPAARTWECTLMEDLGAGLPAGRFNALIAAGERLQEVDAMAYALYDRELPPVNA